MEKVFKVSKSELNFKKGDHNCLGSNMLKGSEYFNSEYSAMYNKLGVGEASVSHSHNKSDELYYIIKGSGSLTVGGETRRIEEGDMVGIPKGSPHSLANDGECMIEYLAIGFIGEMHSGWSIWV